MFLEIFSSDTKQLESIVEMKKKQALNGRKRTGQYLKREGLVLDYLGSKDLVSLNDMAKWWLYNLYCAPFEIVASKIGKVSVTKTTFFNGWEYHECEIFTNCVGQAIKTNNN